MLIFCQRLPQRRRKGECVCAAARLIEIKAFNENSAVIKQDDGGGKHPPSTPLNTFTPFCLSVIEASSGRHRGGENVRAAS